MFFLGGKKINTFHKFVHNEFKDKLYSKDCSHFDNVSKYLNWIHFMLLYVYVLSNRTNGSICQAIAKLFGLPRIHKYTYSTNNVYQILFIDVNLFILCSLSIFYRYIRGWLTGWYGC